jgi:hypothetical protein
MVSRSCLCTTARLLVWLDADRCSA